jgi:glycosyltransferase involved in cell wall biosynthesis
MQTNHLMTRKRPLLTLAIPTYNRGVFLRQFLDSVRDQLRSNSEVELIVSDNASTDETPEIMEEESRRGTRLTYIRNPENIGPDANFLQCYERAGGKYVWVMGDDDVLAPYALQRIVGCLFGDEFDLVYLTPFGFEGDYAPQGNPSPTQWNVRTFDDPEPFVRRVHFFFAMISANIVNKDRVESIGHEPFSKLVGSNLIHLGWIFTALRGHHKSMLIDERLFGYRCENTGGFGICRVFGPALSEVARQWLNVPRLSKLISNGALQRHIPPHLFAAKRQTGHPFLREDAHAILSKAFGKNIRYWICDYPLIVLPEKPAWVWLQIVRIVNRIDRALGFPLLGW